MTTRTLDYLPLDDIPRATVNPKRHSIDVIDASMTRHGYAEPVLLDERTGRLIGGHGRLDTLAAKRDAGEDPPEGIEVDPEGRWLVPVVRGWASASDLDAAAMLVALNRASEIGGWDLPELGIMLAPLTDIEGGLLGVGFTAEYLADLDAHTSPPSLDDLESKYGDPDPTHLWPVLRFKVAPTDRDRYLRLVEGIEGGDDVLFGHLLTLAERE